MGAFCVAWFVAAALHVAADDFCLPQLAVPVGKRKNLVTPQGDSLPLGIWVPDWAAGYAVSAMVHILLEEILGYNVVDQGPGPATPDAFYALAGCRTPSAIGSRGCEKPLTVYSHVSIEGWTQGYQSSWDDIQRDHPATAPLNLGSMGYVGRVSTYLTSKLKQEAYLSEGLTLEYYRAYNVSWTNASKYFDNISAIDRSRLKFCNETRSMVHKVMQQYWEVTGDDEGLDNSTGDPIGKCFEEHFWLSPKCRNEPTKCLIFLTSGPGYNLEHLMQRATAYDSAMAIAVAKDDAAYRALPTELDMLFYAWVPDDSFVALNIQELIYPPSDRAAFHRGDYRGGNPDLDIEKYASQDLAFLAPSVMEFMKAFIIDINVVNSLLQDVLHGDSYVEAACGWLRKNPDIWTEWLPDASQCFPQFGLYDLDSDIFVTDRQNLGPADTLECRACPAGSKSQRFADNDGVTHICQLCDAGSYQSASAALSCIPCPSGEYQDRRGQQICQRCKAGKYQDEIGSTICKACPSGTTSLGRGAVEVEDCGCDAGSIKIDNTSCSPCSDEGILCPFASTLDALNSQLSPLGKAFQPRVLPGFYSAEEDPLSIFKCRSIGHCPGGAPNICAGGRRGIPCSLCPGGQTWVNGSCQDCPVSIPILWALGIALVLGGLVLVYYGAKHFVSARANLGDAVSMVFQVLWELGQTLAVVSQMTITWPEAAQGILAMAKILILDMDDFGLRCLLPGFRTASCYMFMAAGYPAVGLWLLLMWRISQFWREERRWKFPRVVSLMGQVLMTEFSSISNLALVPFMCYSHPNGMHSLLKHPDVICRQEEHTFMLVIGILQLIFAVLGFLVACTFATIMLPAWTAQRRIWRVQMFQFLIIRFRHDSWWYEVPLLTRGPLLSLALVLAIDSPAMQVQSIGLILTFYGFLLATAWPWKLPLLNFFDLALAFGIVVLVNAAPSDTRDTAALPIMAMCLLFGLIFVVIVTTFISAMRWFCCKSEDRYLWNLGTLKKPSIIAAKLKEVSLAMKTQSQREYAQIERAIGNMSVHDVRQMSTCISILAFELLPMKGKAKPSTTSVRDSLWSAMDGDEANFGLYRLSAINGRMESIPSMASEEEDDGPQRGFRFTEYDAKPSDDEDSLPKETTDQAQSLSYFVAQPDEAPQAPMVELPNAPHHDDNAEPQAVRVDAAPASPKGSPVQADRRTSEQSASSFLH